MKSGLFSRIIGLAACASALAMPAHAASADPIEATFDAVFAAKKAEAPRAPVRNPDVVPLFAQAQPKTSYSSQLEASIAALADGSQGRIGVASEPFTRSSMLSMRIWFSCVTALAAQ